MQVREGFDYQAAQAMQEACGLEADDTFMDRAKQTRFWGLYDPQPVGAVLVDDVWLHAGCLRPAHCGFAIRRVVKETLNRQRGLLAAIRQPNRAANRLMGGLGFKEVFNQHHWKVFIRMNK